MFGTQLGSPQWKISERPNSSKVHARDSTENILSFPYFIYHLIYLVIQSPESTANQMMRAVDKERRLSFYVGSYEKWQETCVRSLGREDPLKKEMATHSRTLAWRIPGTEEPGRLKSMGSQRVGHDWATITHTLTHKKWQLNWQEKWKTKKRKLLKARQI